MNSCSRNGRVRLAALAADALQLLMQAQQILLCEGGSYISFHIWIKNNTFCLRAPFSRVKDAVQAFTDAHIHEETKRRIKGGGMFLSQGGDAVIYSTVPPTPTSTSALPGRAINSPDVLLAPERWRNSARNSRSFDTMDSCASSNMAGAAQSRRRQATVPPLPPSQPSTRIQATTN